MTLLDCVVNAGEMYCQACHRCRHKEQRGVYQGVYVRGPCIGGSPPHHTVQDTCKKCHGAAHDDGLCLRVDLVEDLPGDGGDGFPLELFRVVCRGVNVSTEIHWLRCLVL